MLVAWIGHDLSGVHPDPHSEARLSLRKPVEPRHRVAQGDGCADGPESIVLADDRNAEHGHHLVADEFLDGAAVMLDDGGGAIEVPRQDGVHGFGIEPLAELRIADHVAEEHGDDLAARDGGRDEFRPHASQNRAPDVLTARHLSQIEGLGEGEFTGSALRGAAAAFHEPNVTIAAARVNAERTSVRSVKWFSYGG